MMTDTPTPLPRRIPRVFSYKDIETLIKFVTPQGYILPRSRTGLSQKQQRILTKHIKRARHLALLPFTQTI